MRCAQCQRVVEHHAFRCTHCDEYHCAAHRYPYDHDCPEPSGVVGENDTEPVYVGRGTPDQRAGDDGRRGAPQMAIRLTLQVVVVFVLVGTLGATRRRWALAGVAAAIALVVLVSRERD